MAQPKYAARFDNFFANLRLNRDQFADMAAFQVSDETLILSVAVPLATAAAFLWFGITVFRRLEIK